MSVLINNMKYDTLAPTLGLSKMGLKKVPDCITNENFENLVELDLQENEIKEVPQSICFFSKLTKLYFDKNMITEICSHMSGLKRLQELSMSNNMIVTFPDFLTDMVSLKCLILSNNKITEIPVKINNMSNLVKFTMDNNKLLSLPNELSELSKLNIFTFHNNLIETISSELQEFFDKVNSNGGIAYLDKESMEKKYDEYLEKEKKRAELIEKIKAYNYLEDDEFKLETRRALAEYNASTEMHSSFEVTFKEVFDKMMEILIVRTHDKPDLRKEIKRRFDEEMMDSECKCFTGRITRLVNCFSGYFTDLVEIKLSDSEEIGNIITVIKSKYDDIEVVKKEVAAEMKSRGYEQEKIDEWIGYIE